MLEAYATTRKTEETGAIQGASRLPKDVTTESQRLGGKDLATEGRFWWFGADGDDEVAWTQCTKSWDM
jgi:hypothetical protein